MQTVATVVAAPSGIADAISAALTQEALAGALGVTQQAVSAWLKQGWVPVDRAREIEMHYGIPRARLVDPKIMDAVSSGSEL